MYLVMMLNSFFFFLILFMLLLLFFFYMNNIIIILNFNEMYLYSNINFVFLIDFYCLMFMLTVLVVVFNVLNFMNIYMKKNYNFYIFFLFTFLFIMSMIMLILSMNILVMIFGWELLGLSSFFLIFFYNNNDSWKSAIKTFLNNKFGDCMIIISMLNFMLMNNFMEINWLFFFSLMTKSAQYPFMAWLPMAMSAPTPISAMVHSSTLVTAGLYILFRYFNFFFFFFNSFFFLNFCLMSMFFSSLKAMVEKDIKKMIALSTLSQIGLMMFMILLNMKFLTFFYLCNHAFFKSLMFINMGMKMMKNFSNQFNFNMNNLNLDLIYNISFMISCFNLMNIAFFSSFFIKEMMVNMMNFNMNNMYMYIFFFMSSFFTMQYALKLILYGYKLNFKIKFYINFFVKKSNFSFLLMNLISLFYMKMMYNFFLFEIKHSLIIINIYLFMLMMNFYFLNFSNKFISMLMYLNIMIYIKPMYFMKMDILMIEMWMENLTLNFFSKLKSFNFFNINFKTLLIMMLYIMLI
uniref:NADH:ubiquinone reductase (H(+)-translocating) n=1 Tax=Panonychus ulmi TaxID=50024 RepID=D7SGS4_PANUL|nr:NADH dehydrogenase subunit 5 [Panonychus ulmi]ACD02444.1 NADH dehydrogenase subunit 5 [Panonychus ulmi]